MLTRHGAKLLMDPSCYDIYATMRLHGNAWDYHDFEKCYASLPDGSTFYDIGANVGYFAIEVAAGNPTISVVAFEPHSALATAIADSAELNDLRNLQVVEALVGDRCGTADFYLSPASIHASAVSDSGRPSGATLRKPMVTLDSLDLPPPTFIKIDVEGAEHLVLDGARDTIAQHRPHMFLEYMSWADPDQRVRRRLEAICTRHSDYTLIGDPRLDSGRKGWFPISDNTWDDIHAIYALNRDRPLRDNSAFPVVTT
ncbi:methyltransferase, FkbM family [Rhizobiales bacterium GAS191]|nr:methyltransferase, FkbM family [Rhizobiales bacterium GAS191]